MKKLELVQMTTIEGGGIKDFGTGFCAGLGASAGILALAGVATGGAVTAAVGVAGVACGVGSIFGWV